MGRGSRHTGVARACAVALVVALAGAWASAAGAAGARLHVRAERHRACAGTRIVVRASVSGATDLVLGTVAVELRGPHGARYRRNVTVLPDDAGARWVRFGVRVPRRAAPGRYRLTAIFYGGDSPTYDPVLARAADPAPLRLERARSCEEG